MSDPLTGQLNAATSLAGRVRETGRGLAATAAKTAVLAGVAGAAGLAYGSWEKNQFGVRHEELAILPEGAEPLRILHLSDIHFIPGQRKKADWLRSLDELHPDLVVNTGDNLSHRDAIDPLLDALQPLLNRPGVFVPGSNDYFAPRLKSPLAYFAGPSRQRKEPVALDWPRLRAGFGMSGWVDLTNRNQSLVFNRMRFDFSGMDDPHIQREKFTGWPQGTAGTAPSLRIGVVHVSAGPGHPHRGGRGTDPLRPHPWRPGLHPRLRRARVQLRSAHLAGPRPARLGEQGTHDAGQRLRRNRHLPLRALPHRLPPGGRGAGPDGTRGLTSRSCVLSSCGFRASVPTTAEHATSRTG